MKKEMQQNQHNRQQSAENMDSSQHKPRLLRTRQKSRTMPETPVSNSVLSQRPNILIQDYENNVSEQHSQPQNQTSRIEMDQSQLHHQRNNTMNNDDGRNFLIRHQVTQAATRPRNRKHLMASCNEPEPDPLNPLSTNQSARTVSE